MQENEAKNLRKVAELLKCPVSRLCNLNWDRPMEGRYRKCIKN